jgi:hypothetical protein
MNRTPLSNREFNALKGAITSHLLYLSDWKDNGECRQYFELNLEQAQNQAEEILEDWIHIINIGGRGIK